MITARPGRRDDGRCQIGGCETPDKDVTLLYFNGMNFTAIIRLCRGDLRALQVATADRFARLAGLGHHNRAAVVRKKRIRAERKFKQSGR